MNESMNKPVNKSMNNTLNIIHNTEFKRFETTVAIDDTDYTGFISYQNDDDKLIYDHTIVPKELGGRGIGSALVKHALNYAQKEDKKVVPACSFVAHYIDKHSEYQSLLAK